jgi:hypothetical protein
VKKGLGWKKDGNYSADVYKNTIYSTLCVPTILDRSPETQHSDQIAAVVI